MSTAALLDEMFDPLARCLDAPTARRVVDLEIAPAVQERVNSLAQAANEGALTADEQAEYEALINAADFIAILKSKASRSLDASTNQ